MSVEAWVGIGIAVLVMVLAIVAHQRYRREIARAKKSRWATWRDEPRGVYEDKYGGPRHGGGHH